MFLLTVAILLILFAMYSYSNICKKDADAFCFSFPVISGVIFLIIFTIWTGVGNFHIVNTMNNIDCFKQNLLINQDNYDKMSTVILDTLSKFPYENRTYSEMSPEILLKLPEIKSDNIINAQIQTLNVLNGKIVTIKEKINSEKNWLRKQRFYGKFFYIKFISIPDEVMEYNTEPLQNE